MSQSEALRPFVLQVNLENAGQEYSLTVPKGTKHFTIQIGGSMAYEKTFGITRANATKDVAPTMAEIAAWQNPFDSNATTYSAEVLNTIIGDNCFVNLNDETLEQWELTSFSPEVWTKVGETDVSSAGHTGTTGSVFFAGAGGAGSSPTEDNANFFWDDTANELGIGNNTPTAQLDVRGSNGGIIALTTSDTTVTGSGNKLGQIDFSAPLEADGGDAILVAASIYAEAEAVFDATTNSTSLVFATGTSEAATEKARLTADGELGVGTNNPTAFIHAKRTIGLEADWIGYIERDGTVSSTGVFVVKESAATDVDFAVWGDGRVGIGLDQATTNAMLRVEAVSGGPSIAAAFIVDQNRTGTSINCARFIHAADTVDAIDVTADSLTTATALDISCNALTTGVGIGIVSSSSSVAQRELIKARNTNSAATGCRPLYIEQFADGKCIEVRQNASDILYELLRDGHWKQLPLASNTDTAPTDDATLKKLSIQRLAADPTNAAFIKFSNSPGTPTNDFYLVLEEG